MRIFLSHKQEDAPKALAIAAYLSTRNIPYYLDTLDDAKIGNPAQLTLHLKEQVERSSHLMAIVSQKTQASWWVPFEIGLASEHGNAISTFLLESVRLPEYLEPWPYLRSANDLDNYVSLLYEDIRKSFDLMDSVQKRASASGFERRLKQRLGQV